MQCQFCGEEMVQMFEPFCVDCPTCRERQRGNSEYPIRFLLPHGTKPYIREMEENWVSEATKDSQFPPKVEVRRGEIGTSEWWQWLWEIEEIY